MKVSLPIADDEFITVPKNVLFYFEKNLKTGYENIVQFLSDVFCLAKQMRSMNSEAWANKLKLLGQMIKNTPVDKRHYPMDKMADLSLTLTEQSLLILLIRRHLISPIRGLNLDDALMANDGGQLPLEDIFSFFVLKKGVLRESGLIEETPMGCILKKSIKTNSDETSSKPKQSVKRISPQQIEKQLDKFVIGQKQAKEKLSVAFFEHLVKCDLMCEKDSFYKNNILLIGPTGTGKTYLCQTLAKMMNVPFLHADMSQFTASGYVGNSVKDIIVNLAEMTHPKNRVLPISIVFLDEIDKITSKKCTDNGRDVRGTSVQEELLRMLESKQMRVETRNMGRSDQRTYDISRVFFVAAGACSGIEKVVAQRLKASQGVGFIHSPSDISSASKQVIAQDLLEYGFLPEFLSRFCYVAQLEALTQNQLVEVLLHTKDNVLSQYKEVFAACKEPLKFTQHQAEVLAQRVYGHELGVRALNQLVAEEMSKRLIGCQYKQHLQKEAEK